MANSEFIEFLSPSALKDLQTANAELVTMISNVDKVGTKMKGITTPSGSDSAIKSLTAEYQKQEKVITNLQNKVEKARIEQEKKNKVTGEEIVNNRILAKNADNLAMQNSKLAGAYSNLSAKTSELSQRYRDLIISGKKAGQTQKEFEKELRSTRYEFEAYNKKLLQADKAVGAWGRSSTRALDGLKDLMGAFGIVGGVTLFASITKDIYETTKQLQSLEMAMLQVVGSQENLTNQQQFLARISEDYGIELMSLTKQFTQFYVSAKDKLSANQIQDIFESISKASASMGLSQQQSERAFLALNQMMSKGTIQAEELRGQLGEALPGAFGIMAKAVGVTEKELGNMMKAGDVLAKDVLPKFAKQLEITYGIENVNRINNIASAQNRVTNQWTAFVDSLSSSDPKNGVSFFQKVMMSAEGLLLILTRLNTSWDELYKKANLKGAEAGKNNFERLIQNFVGDEEKIKQAESSIRVAKNNIESITKQIENLQNKLKNTSPYALRLPWSESPKDIKLQIESLQELLGEQNGVIEASKQFLNTKNETNNATETTNKLTKEQIKAQKDLNKAIEEELRLRNALEIAQAERELKLLNLSSEEKTYINDRLNLLDDIAQKETQIALLKYEENIRLHKDSNTQMEIDAIEFSNTITDINKKRVDDGLKELDRYYKEFEDYNAKFEGEGIKLNIFGDNPEVGFEKWKQGADKAKESTDKLKEATKDWLKSFADSFGSEYGFDTLFDILNKKIEGFGEDFDTTFVGVTEVFQEAMNFMNQASDNRFANEYANLEQQKEVALMFAGESASAREEIERQYEQRQREIKRREFQAKKQQAIFNIAIDTAQGIMSALAQGNIPLSIVIGVIGAIQAGMVASQQVPQFWKGTDNAPEGWALTQERGREIITDKKGNIKSLGNDKGATMTYLNKGDKVLNNDKTMDYLMFNNDLNSMLTSNDIAMPKVNIESPKFDLTPVIDAINNKESVSLNIDKDGLNMLVKNGHSTKEILNRKVNFIAKSV